MAVFVIPSAVLEAASNIPERGLMKNPVTPCQVPFKKPGIPPMWAPLYGFENTLKIVMKE